MDFYHLAGYMSGLLVIKPNMEAISLYRTIVLVHVLDAIICSLIANHSRRRTLPWTISGLIFGIWALATLFLLPIKNPTK